jgi:hypothetical protein
MRFLNALRLTVCIQVLAVAVAGSTVAKDEAVLLYEQNFIQGIGVSDAEAPLFRHFYDVAATSSKKSQNWSNTGGDIIVATVETPPLKAGFSGSFIFDTNAPERSEFAARITDFREQLEAEGLGLYVGLSRKSDDPAAGVFGAAETSLGIHDSRLPGSKLEFVRFDINEWQVSAGVVNYDINISYWGQPAAEPEKSETGDI